MTDSLEIACDEAGYTGPDLLQAEQRYFAFASIQISDAEASEIIQRVRARHPVQMPELKAKKLMTSDRGRKLIKALLDETEGRYVFSVFDKLLALCAQIFEYIYEPVYQADPRLLYEKKLHRFVAMYAWLWFQEGGSEALHFIQQFQQYMRTRDPADAPFLFDTPRPPLSTDGSEHPFECVLRFAYGYREIIITDNADLETVLPQFSKVGIGYFHRRALESSKSLGTNKKPLLVRCDASKPLRAMAPTLKGDASDAGIERAHRLHAEKGSLGWCLAEPVSFVNSRRRPSVQLADVIAGGAVAMLAKEVPDSCVDIHERLAKHIHPHSILPDFDTINPANRSAAVNALVLYDLAQRAERGRDPYADLEFVYRLAEVASGKGDYRLDNR